MTTSEKVTILRKSLTPDALVWSATTYRPFSMHIKKVTSSTTKADYKSGIMKLRIKNAKDICKPGDMIETGEFTGDAPSENAWEVYSVTENTFGSEYMHHVNILAGR